MIVDVDHPTRGTYQTVGCPIKLSIYPSRSAVRRCWATPTCCLNPCAESRLMKRNAYARRGSSSAAGDDVISAIF